MAVELRHVAGATGVDVPGGSAVSGRGAAFVAGVVGVDPTQFATTMPAAAAAVAEALAPWTTAELNPNFAGTGTAVWDPATADRLAAVRRTYDPAGAVRVTAVWGGVVKAAPFSPARHPGGGTLTERRPSTQQPCARERDAVARDERTA